jgi:hypothetical protein
VRDATGQTFQQTWRVNGSEWSTINQPLTAAAFVSHWGGAGDGVLHFPLKEALIAISKRAPTYFGLANLSVACDGCAGAGAFDVWRVDLEPSGASAGVTPASAAASVGARLRVVSLVGGGAPSPPLSVSVALRPANANESGVSDVPCLPATALPLRPWESRVLQCAPASSLTAGYYVVGARACVGDGKCGDSEAGLLLTAPDATAAAGAFGVQMLGAAQDGRGAAARLMGATGVRVLAFWRYVESSQGSYEWAATDAAVAQAAAAGMRVTLSLLSRAPTWAKWSADPSGDWPAPAAVAGRFGAVCGAAARRFGGAFDAVELDNEPDTCLQRESNSQSPDPARPAC